MKDALEILLTFSSIGIQTVCDFERKNTVVIKFTNSFYTCTFLAQNNSLFCFGVFFKCI